MLNEGNVEMGKLFLESAETISIHEHPDNY